MIYQGSYFRVCLERWSVVVMVSASNAEYKGLEFRVGVKHKAVIVVMLANNDI